jgi:hypothetical protein
VLLPHLRDRAMVMKRTRTAAGDFFFMKRANSPAGVIHTCSIAHDSDRIDFPMIQIALRCCGS